MTLRVAPFGEEGCDEHTHHSGVGEAHYAGGEIHEVESAGLPSRP